MLRLYDTRAGRVEEILPARRGRLRLCVPGSARPGADVGELRVLLLSDLICRVAELHGLSATVAQETTDALRRDAGELNIRPSDAGPPDDGLIDLVVEPTPEDDADAPDAVARQETVRHRVRAERMRSEGSATAAGPGRSPDDAFALSDLAGRGLDPLALRLALLDRHYREPAVLTWDDLHASGHALDHWRDAVARWAESPSAPMPEAYTREAFDALCDDLDTPRALRALRRLEEDDVVAPGAKFETFAFLDRVLALDLAREIGKRR